MKSGSAEEQEPSRITAITVGTGIDNSSTWSLVSPSSRSFSRPSLGLRRRGSSFFSALKALGSPGAGSRDKPVNVEERPVEPSKDAITKPIILRGLYKMSNAIFRAAMEPTVIHRTNAKGRPPLHVHQTFQQTSNEFLSFPSPPTSARSANNTTHSSATNSAKTTPKNSTGQTSMDSSLKGNTKDAANPNHNSNSRGGGYSSPERRAPPTAQRQHHHNAVSITSHLFGRHHRDNHANHDEERDKSPDSMLTTIQETPLDQITPSILTVERAAAAKINLETYYQELLCSGPSAREIRTQLLEAHILKLSRQRRHNPIQIDAEIQSIKARFYRRETEYLREMRVLKTKSMRALREPKKSAMAMNNYEELTILGKGSFGVVKLVREKDRRGHVYAMKCIRKGDMLKTQQEGHLRAERDFLIASEGSRWIIQLVASFQDIRNLYLVTEYMPGGDFLGFLIRENVLEENVARFYVAEMILCVEAAHSLKFIHRDIKPDNFLISQSGHLKISDFGLAFDGAWMHDMSYYNSHRYSLVNKLGIVVEGDEKDKTDMRSMQETMKWTSHVMTGIEKHQSIKEGEEVLNWRNRCGNRVAARSVVGTSQYMAPEVVLGDNYDARCDYWSVAIILYECLYGQTPFYSEEGRNLTKKNILEHKEKFKLPAKGGPGGVHNVSSRCRDLMASLITDKEHRLCSKRYKMKDLLTGNAGPSSGLGIGSGGSMSAAMIYGGGSQSNLPCAGGGPSSSTLSVSAVSAAKVSRDYAGRYVFPYDAEDIKGHKWFRSIPWEKLHLMTPPHVPRLTSCDDTAYFNDKSVSDWSDTEPSSDEEDIEARVNVGREIEIEPGTPPGLVYDEDLKYQPQERPSPEDEQLIAIEPLRECLQKWALAAVSMPLDGRRLADLEGQIDCMTGVPHEQREYLRQFVYRFGVPRAPNHRAEAIMVGGPPPPPPKKKQKRPRDRILRDKQMAKIVLEERRRTAFGGYEWRRIRDEDDEEDEEEEELGANGGGCTVDECDQGRESRGAALGLDGEGGEYYNMKWGWPDHHYLTPIAATGYHGHYQNHHNHPQQYQDNQYRHTPPPQHGPPPMFQQQLDEFRGGLPHQVGHHPPHFQSPSPHDGKGGGFGGWGEDVSMVRALHRGRYSLR
ncbi:kinase-like protein [Podospora fimiseda]|uniref:non-specific serine/threonine protein kinase n=1 Tax=Podospora fimiseda TaxID=252190 RepID=A0AAN7H880_9PEZI|nr:kinase-like protein [Podospora fimiseda]